MIAGLGSRIAVVRAYRMRLIDQPGLRLALLCLDGQGLLTVFGGLKAPQVFAELTQMKRFAGIKKIHLLILPVVILWLTGCLPATPTVRPGALSVAAEMTPTPASGDMTTEALDEDFLNETTEEEQFLFVEELIVGLLLVAVVVGIVARRLRMPYTVGLVVIGLLLTLQGRIDIQVSPNLILALLLPPLIFEAAFHLNYNDLRHNLTIILAFAVLGVILTTILVGGMVAWGTGLALPVALVFGAWCLRPIRSLWSPFSGQWGCPNVCN